MEYKISVRKLVEFIYRSGDLEGGVFKSTEKAMLEGTRIHKYIQKNQPANYKSEVSLKYTHHTRKFDLIIEGRADGIIENDDIVTIDEIKATYMDVSKITEPLPLHLEQAKVYAAIYLIQNELNKICVRLTYCNVVSKKIKYLTYDFSASSICNFLDDLINKYLLFVDFKYSWGQTRDASIKNCSFPYEYREGQKKMVAGVYKTITLAKKLFLQAPTGCGKTITTFYPSMQALGRGLADKIFYLTPKSTLGDVLSDTINMLRREQKIRLKTITITAKDKICLKKEASCSPDKCPYASGHYSHINEAIYDLLTHEDNYNQDTITFYAAKYKVCPFELSLDMSLFADVIICDYNYAFDPFVYLKRFFSGKNDNKFIFLIDEAHNLVDRARNMYSASLCLDDISSLINMENLADDVKNNAKLVHDEINKIAIDSKRPQILERDDEFEEMLQTLANSISVFLNKENTIMQKELLIDIFFKIHKFISSFGYGIKDNKLYSEWDEDTFKMVSYCVDPSKALLCIMDLAVSTILFSATFLPIQYYKSLLGGRSDDFEMYADSIFDKKKQKLIIASDLNTKYVNRNDDLYKKIAEYINKIYESHHGNYLVFFPSYVFMQEVYDKFMQISDTKQNIDILLQGPSMTDIERNDYISRFTTKNDLNLSEMINMDIDIVDNRDVIGFCLMGGIFSEGIDLVADRLIGSIIIGTGTPLVCNEKEIVRLYFDEKGKDGFNYAYRYPGMNKVMQAAGRVIRTADDIGIVVLLDNRFLEREYQRLFPRDWSNFQKVSTGTVNDILVSFWNNFPLK